MADTDFQIQISAKLEDGALENIKKQINNLTSNKDPIKIKVDTKDAQKQIAQLKKDIQSLGKFSDTLKVGTKSSSSASKASTKILDFNSKTAGMVNDMNADYKKLKYLAEQMGKIEVKVKGLDATKNVEQIKVLESHYRSLKERYQELVASSPKLNEWHIEELNKQIEKTGFELDRVIAKNADLKAEIERNVALDKANQDFKQLVSTAKEFERLSIKLVGLDQSTEEAKELSSQIQNVVNKMNQLQSSSNLSTEQMKQFSDLRKQTLDNIQNATNLNIAKNTDKQNLEAEKDALDKINQEFKELIANSNQLGSLKVDIVGVDQTSQEFQVLNNQIAETERKVNSLSSSLSGKLSTAQQNEIAKLNKQWQDRETLSQTKFTEKLKSTANAKFDLFEGTKDADFTNIQNSLKKIQNQSDSTKNAVKEFNKALDEMKRLTRDSDPSEVINAYSKYQETLRVAKTNISADLKRNVNDLDRQKLSNNMQQWLNQNTRAAKAFGNQVHELIAELKNCDNVTFGNIKRQFSNLQAQAKAQGLTGQSFFSSLSSKMKELSAYYTAADVLQRGVQVVEDMARNVAAVDKSMTELYRVTDLSEQAYDSLYKTMVADAKQYGAELDVLINSTASWVRLGFGADEAEKLAGVSAMYQHVTDLDEKTAVENLVTAYKGFQDELLEVTNGDSVKAVEKISDIMDSLGEEVAHRKLYRLISSDGQDRGKTKYLIFNMDLKFESGDIYREIY